MPALETFIAIIVFVFSLILSLLITRFWIDIARKNAIAGRDLNKYNKPIVTEGGGIAVVISITLAILFFVFFKTFILKSLANIPEILILTITLVLAGFMGFVDDILGWKKGIKGWQRLIITFPIAIPLMVTNVGQSTMNLPFIGAVNFGFLYPLLLVPLGVIGASNGYNLLAGYNGLEAGLGVIIFAALGIISLITGQLWLALIAGIIILALLGFLLYNKFPAKLFPGDSLTFSIGALIACFAILGNMERAAFLLFIPFIVEGILKAKSGFKAETFGLPNQDNSLEPPYNKIYSLTHLSLIKLKEKKPSHKVYEQDVVNSLWLLQFVIAVIVLVIMLV